MLDVHTHQPRPIRFLAPLVVDGWSLKIYGISANRSEPPEKLVRAAIERAPSVLPEIGDDVPGYGWVIVHDARDYNFVLCTWIANENEIHQHVLFGPLDQPDRLDPLPSPAVGCVWELAVTDFERRAWLKHVLANPSGPDLDAYSAERLSTEL